MNVKKNAVIHSITASMAAMSLFATASVQACESEPYLGTVCMTAATYCPVGYAEANGQLLPISQFQALFSLLGTNYGGDGRNNFGVPDMRGRSAVGLGQAPGLTAVKPGEKRGAETTTLSVNNMPVHTHEMHSVNADGTSDAADSTWPANPVADDRGTAIPTKAFATGGEQVTLNSGVVGTSGESTSFNNLPPQLGVRFCIATKGIYPSHP